MLIYDKNGNNIDIYTMNPKLEELKRYRKNVIRRQKIEDMFYSLKTNCPNTLTKFNTNEDVDIKFLDYDNDMVIETGYWSRLCPMGNVGPYDKEIQQKIIENYIEGVYDSVKPVKVFDYNWEDDITTELNRLLKTEPEKIVNIHSRRNTWEINNLINLPKSLYLLHLLQHGQYGRLLFENITRQLSLFDIEYLKSISIVDIKNVIETSLVSGTLYDAVSRADVGSKILQKRKK